MSGRPGPAGDIQAWCECAAPGQCEVDAPPVTVRDIEASCGVPRGQLQEVIRDAGVPWQYDENYDVLIALEDLPALYAWANQTLGGTC